MMRLRNLLLSFGLVAGLTACAMPTQMALRAVPVSSLPGWQSDHQAQALPGLIRDCERLALLPQDQALGGSGLTAQLAGKAGSWAGVCAEAKQLDPGNDAAIRAFYEQNFVAYQVTDHGRANVLFTGYYEPEVAGSRERGGIYQTPIYGRPDDLALVDLGQFDGTLAGRHSVGHIVDGHFVPYPERAQIEAGALRLSPLLYLASPVDAFFLQVQGSGRVRLPDGSLVRVAYAGQNGQPYTAIGKILADERQIAPNQIDAQTIRAWLLAHPDRAKQVMDQNKDYVFFREVEALRPQDGPPGALDVSLTPDRSAAIDRAYIPLGASLWVDTTDPIHHTAWQHLMQAEDLGAAIKGPLRADLFYGWGKDAEQRAGLAHQQGHEYVLLPRPIAQPTSTAPRTH